MKVNDQRQKLATLSMPKGNPVHLEFEAGWGLEIFWTFWGREKSLTSVGIRTQDRPERSAVSIPTALIKTVNVGIFFPPSNATTCPLWTSWSPLPVVAEV
jgi:hypothetical protein